MNTMRPAEAAIYDTYGQGDTDRTRRIVAALRPALYREAAEALLDRVPPLEAGPRTEQERGLVDAARILQVLADGFESE